MKLPSIKQLPAQDRPREKMRAQGAEHLSDIELIAILLGAGHGQDNAISLAQKLFIQAENQLSRLAVSSAEQLQEMKGIGVAKSLTLLAAFALGKRLQKQPQKRSAIKTSASAYQLLRLDLEDKKEEECWVLFLNRAHRLIKKQRLSKGGWHQSVLDIRTLFQHALRCHAPYFIFAHNHPSGELSPSDQDIKTTQKICEGAATLSLKMLDHLIIGPTGYYSFLEHKLLFS